jgi:hypothetical protein
MPDPKTVALISLAIAVAAFVVSVVALWRTHFARMRPITLVGPLRHRIYPVKSDDSRWFLTSFDVAVSFCNPGAQPVLIDGVRLKLHFPGIPIPQNAEVLEAKWELEPALAPRIDKNRFQWLRDLSPKSWMDFSVLPKETLIRHLIFESRWDDPVIQKVIRVDLETQTSANQQWMRVARWEVHLDARTWGELAHNGTSMTYNHEGHDLTDEQCTPTDLHKYTGSKDPIPKEGFGAAPSFLDYPK